MKLKLERCYFITLNTLKKVILLSALLAMINIHAFAQIKKQISFTNENPTKVFKKLEKDFEVRFFYANSILDKSQSITMPLQTRTLDEVMNYLSVNYDYAFKNNGDMIAVNKGVRKTTGSDRIGIKGRAGLINGDNIEYVGGITVRELGTQNAAITDENGYFTINTTNSSTKLQFSYIGYGNTEIEVNGNAIINVSLKQDLSTLKEVVITSVSNGYQTLAKKNTTGSVSTISQQDLERRNNQSFERILEGAIPGLSVYNGYSGNSGARRSAPDIQLRGGSAVQSERNTPLIVVDGFPVNRLPDNFNDVEKIDVLKDASAAAIWGARAANGVIVITTKRGKQGKLTINFSSNLELKQQDDFNALRRASAADMISVDNELFRKQFFANAFFQGPTNQSGFSPSFDLIMQRERNEISAEQLKSKQDSLALLSNVDQNRDLLQRVGVTKNNYLAIVGGTEKYRFNFSGSHINRKSNYIGDSQDNIQINTRNDYEVTTWLVVSADINGTFIKNNIGLDLRNQLYAAPIYQLQLDDSGNYMYDYSAFNRYTNKVLSSKGFYNYGRNILEDVRLANNTSNAFGLRTKLTADITLTKGLKLSTSYLYDRLKNTSRNLVNEFSTEGRILLNNYAGFDVNGNASFNLPKGNYLNQAETTNSNNAFRSQLTYTNLIGGKHFINLSSGVEVKKYLTDGTSSRKFNFNDNLLSWTPFNQTSMLAGVATWRGNVIYDATQFDRFVFKDIREVSYYFSGVYTYDDKYTLSGSLRVDESNLFGVDPEYRRTPLWSFGAAWDAVKEDFFDISFINTFKLRATLGLSGNFDPSTTPLLVATRSAQPNTNDLRSRVDGNNPYNPKLRWERTKTFNVGLDLGFFKNRLQASVDVYQKNGYDLLGTQLIDPTLGFTSTRVNASNMTNRGVETSITGNIIQTKNFNWSSTLNFAYNANKITNNRVSDSNPVISRVIGTQSARYSAGYTREALWSYSWAGLSNIGDPQVYDGNGNKVLVPVFGSLEFSGSFRPTYVGSINNVLTYKNIFASTLLIYNLGGVFRREMPSMNGYNWSSSLNYQVTQRWLKPGDENFTDVASFQEVPSALYDGRDRAMLYSSNSVESSNFLRLREVRVGYRLQGAILNKTPFKSLALSVQMNNVALWTKNKYGIDPEAIDPINGTYYLPEPKITTIGLNASF